MFSTNNKFCVLIVSFIFYSTIAEANDKDEELKNLINAANEISSNYYDLGWFSGSVLIAKNNQTVFDRSLGLQNQESKTVNQSATRYNLGSIMKDFTRVLVLQHIQSNELSLESTLDEFELGFPVETARKITVEHLLTHRSGFADIFNAEYRENPLKFDSLQKKLNLLLNQPLLFEPGTDYRYTNYGYIVLGSILEKITQKSFSQLLSERILSPLELVHSTLDPNQTHSMQSTRYTYLYDNSLKEVGVTEHPGPDGGLESTTSDVQTFYHSLFHSKKLLNTDSPIFKQVFGSQDDHWGSYGGGLGISAAVEVDLKNNVEIIVLANTDNLVAERISGRILNYLREKTYQPVKPRAQNLAYSYYKKFGKEKFFSNFKAHYQEQGYQQFIGRPINDLGMQLIKTQSWSDALDVFNYLVHLFPKAPQAYDSLAYGYFKQGEFEKAKATFLTALNISPDFKSDYSSNNYGVENYYLGQKPPGNTPIVFAPGIVTTDNYTYGPTFTPSMKEFHFLRIKGDNDHIEHVTYRYNNFRWELESESKRSGQPMISPSGTTMHLGSRYRDKQDNGWSDVKEHGLPFSEISIMRMTSSLNGLHVFDEIGSAKGDGKIRYSQLNKGTLEAPNVFGKEINAGTFNAHPFIAPDETYMIWDSRRESGFGHSDLYISFRQADGAWGKAINMGDDINSEGWDAAASVTPDGKYIFFHRLNDSGNANIYWVKADIIEQLKASNK